MVKLWNGKIKFCQTKMVDKCHHHTCNCSGIWFCFQELQRNKVNIIGIILPPTLDVIIGFLFILVVVIVNPFIWYFLMNGCGAQISKKEASGIWWSTNIAKYVPGRVSIIASRVWVARKWGPKVVLESLGWELILTTSSALIASSLLIFSTESSQLQDCSLSSGFVEFVSLC